MLEFYRNLLVFIAAVAVGVILADASRLVLNTMVEFWEESKPEASANNSPANSSDDWSKYGDCEPTDLCLIPNTAGGVFSLGSSSIGAFKLAVLKPAQSEGTFGRLLFLGPDGEMQEFKVESMRVTEKETWFETENINGAKFVYVGLNDEGTRKYPASCILGRLDLISERSVMHTHHLSLERVQIELPSGSGACSTQIRSVDETATSLFYEAFKKKGYFYPQGSVELERRRLGGLMAVVIDNYYSDPEDKYSSFGTLIFEGGAEIKDLESNWRYWSIDKLDFVGNKVELETETQFGKRITFSGEYEKNTGDNVGFNTVVMTGKLSLYEGKRHVRSIESSFSWEEYREKCFL